MRVFLAQAYLEGRETPVFPLGLNALAASLTGHEVEVFDPNVAAAPMEELVARLQTFRPQVLGLSLRNIDSTNKREVVFYYQFFRTMLETIRPHLPPGCRIVVGGSGFSMFAMKIMDDLPEIDFGVYREGERVLPELLDNLDEPEKVAGLFYRDGSGVVFTGPAPLTDMEKRPGSPQGAVDFAPYQDLDDAIGVETKRGCNLNCIYCIYGFLNGKQLRLRSPEQVVDDIEAIAARGCPRFTFVDSVFNYPLDHAQAICKEMIRRRLTISWSAWFHEKFVSSELIELVIEAGCDKVIFSPDGFSDTTLRLLGKSFRHKDIISCFEIMRQFPQVEVCYNFFKNPPGQGFITFIRLLLFYFKAKKVFGPRVHFEFNSLRVEPHTRLYDLALKEGVVSPDDDLLFPVQYSNPGTRYIEKLFDLLATLKGK